MGDVTDDSVFAAAVGKVLVCSTLSSPPETFFRLAGDVLEAAPDTVTGVPMYRVRVSALRGWIREDDTLEIAFGNDYAMSFSFDDTKTCDKYEARLREIQQELVVFFR